MRARAGQVEHDTAVTVVAREAVDLRKPEPVAVERHDLVQVPGLAGDSHLHHASVNPGHGRARTARVYSSSKPRRCAFSCDFEPGWVVSTATSQPAAAASASRADSRAD